MRMLRNVHADLYADLYLYCDSDKHSAGIYCHIHGHQNFDIYGHGNSDVNMYKDSYTYIYNHCNSHADLYNYNNADYYRNIFDHRHVDARIRNADGFADYNADQYKYSDVYAYTDCHAHADGNFDSYFLNHTQQLAVNNTDGNADENSIGDRHCNKHAARIDSYKYADIYGHDE
jgi:hypothetical protein